MNSLSTYIAILYSICCHKILLTARKIGEESILLLKNEQHLLPIDFAKNKTITVIGENAIKWMTVGGGSSSLKAKYEINPLDGIKNKFGNRANIVYARGYVGDTTGEYNGVVARQHLADYRSSAELLEEAKKIAQIADLVIIVGGLNKSDHQDAEGMDRLSYNLPYGQDQLIEQLANVNKNIIFVNISGNAIAMPWRNKVPTILQDWYLGSEAGNALADNLVGDANPSGKLPFSFPVKLEDIGAHALHEFPGTDTSVIKKEYLWAIDGWKNTK